jgi:hypothetical protein
MVYGKSTTLDMERLVDMLQALEVFLAVRDHNGRGGNSGDLASVKVNNRTAMNHCLPICRSAVELVVGAKICCIFTSYLI